MSYLLHCRYRVFGVNFRISKFIGDFLFQVDFYFKYINRGLFIFWLEGAVLPSTDVPEGDEAAVPDQRLGHDNFLDG